MQRASMEAAAAFSSSGNSRETKRTLPVSMYFDRSIGNTFSSKSAQCGQVSEEYSTIVTGALSLPSAMSGRAGGFASSVKVCALPAWAGDEKTAPSTTRLSAARRTGLDNGLLRPPGLLAPSRAGYFAGPRGAMRQSDAAFGSDPGAAQVEAKPDQPQRDGQAKAGQHRDRLQRLIGAARCVENANNECGQSIHGFPPLTVPCGKLGPPWGELLSQKRLWTVIERP